MMEHYKSILLVIAFALCASGTVVRNTRQFSWDFGTNTNLGRDSPLYDSYGPYGICGKPDLNIPHGGMDLFSASDRRLSRAECDADITCEPKFYCDEGYQSKGEHLLRCEVDTTTKEGKWEGHTQTCVKSFNFPHIIVIPVGAVVFILSLLAAFTRRYYVKRRNVSSGSAPAPATTNGGPSRSSQGGGWGYKRFNDSNVQVQQNAANAVVPNSTSATA